MTATSTNNGQAMSSTDPREQLARQWSALAQAWDIDGARALADTLDYLLDGGAEVNTDAVADLIAYLAVFADGALVPNRSQLGRLQVLVEAALGAPAQTAAPVASLAEASAANTRPQEARNTLCSLDVTEALAPGLVASLTERGYQVRAFDDGADLATYLRSHRPAALLIEAGRLRSMPKLVAALAETAPGTPLGPALIVLSGTRDLTHRLLAMRSGAAAFFGAPLDSYRIVARIEELLGHQHTTPYRVLLVDADREHSAQCGRWLVEQGMTARLARDGRAAIGAIAEFRPDIVLMDFELPDAHGFELAQLMHQQPEFAAVPIVLYSADADDAQRFDAIAAGADEVLLKPLKPRHLTAVIRSRVQRAQWLRGQAEYVAGRDPRTGLFLRQHVLERLGHPDFPRGSALLFVGLDRVDRVREAVGLSGLAQFELEAAQAFREALASGDMAAPLSDYTWLVIAAREHRDQVTELAERLRAKLAERRAGGGEHSVPVTASIGISLLDAHEPQVDARVARAEAACMAAGRVSGNRVMWYEPSDFSLVRPDPQLAVRAVLSRPWNESNGRVEFRPIVPLTGKLGGQFDFVYAMVSTQDAGARADYAQFAPVAAEMNVLREVERRRFEAAFAARESRLKLGRQVRLFMPVLADTLLDAAWLDDTLATMRERKLSGTGLTLELGSRDLLDRRDALAPVLQRLRQLGIRVGLSDYGMDWAAVHVLSTLTVDFLRLDPELVTHTTSDKAVSTTLLALVRKAHQLGAAVLAPNVESIDRAHVLLRLGIDYGVGDGLARPLAEPEFDFNRPIW
jgi:DNA-binding response OmpR family regulator/EAL domain-containing protein (putative c-di-GMP-specific phosphodiesterase class I)